MDVFDDTDLIYIGVNSNFDGIEIAKSIRRAGLNAIIIFSHDQKMRYLMLLMWKFCATL